MRRGTASHLHLLRSSKAGETVDFGGGHTVSDLSASGPYLDDLFLQVLALDRRSGRVRWWRCARARRPRSRAAGPAAGRRARAGSSAAGHPQGGPAARPLPAVQEAGPGRIGERVAGLGHPPAHLDGPQDPQAIAGGHAAGCPGSRASRGPGGGADHQRPRGSRARGRAPRRRDLFCRHAAVRRVPPRQCRPGRARGGAPAV